MKSNLYIPIVFLIFISCNEKVKDEMTYKKNTKDVLFYNNLGIKDKSAQKIFNDGLENVENEKFDIAKDKFIEANEIEKENPTILNAIAQVELRLGNTKKSIEILLNIISIDSTYVETYVNLGANYMSFKEYDKAKEILTKGLKFTTNKNLRTKSILLLNLAIVNNNLGDFESGLKYSKEALEISEHNDVIEFAENIKVESEKNINWEEKTATNSVY